MRCGSSGLLIPLGLVASLAVLTKLRISRRRRIVSGILLLFFGENSNSGAVGDGGVEYSWIAR